ncbi:RUN domain-containing protein 1 [Drosophila pseudoobscura]|uniref:RUN domain-containing protein 1 n=1 Tax=Drosophila pseudoobscura pseudoobscura TaxID=46245 RepID=A0A6I8UF37_DROPS|nr:RUN domain-containing protein 1 [Drosophila pseudoobscura]
MSVSASETVAGRSSCGPNPPPGCQSGTDTHTKRDRASESVRHTKRVRESEQEWEAAGAGPAGIESGTGHRLIFLCKRETRKSKPYVNRTQSLSLRFHLEMEEALQLTEAEATESMESSPVEGQQPVHEVNSCHDKAATYPEETETETDPEHDPEPEQMLSERWSPLGANYDDANSASSGVDCELEPTLLGLSLEKSSPGNETENASELARLRSIEEEQELLTSSLLALTSHFAHVQLRVRQIVEAPAEERDQLLRDLDDFAFQGIPDAGLGQKKGSDAEPERETETDGQLIEQLKSQLTELEQLAYEAGEPGILPQHVLLEKQKFILDELRAKLNLQVEQQDLPSLSTDQLRHQVDNAIGEFVGPLKMKEQLVAQLKTQITDLERFIAFLQCDAAGSGSGSSASGSDRLKLLSGAYNSYAAKQTARSQVSLPAPAETSPPSRSYSHSSALPVAQAGESLHSKAHGLLDKASILMQMFATTHLAKPREDFQQNTLKKTHKGNHWGDLRAQLEVDIQEVAALAATLSCDREKLANIKRALRQQQQQQQQQAGSSSTCLNPQNGALITLPPRCRRAVAAGHELAPYAAAAASAATSSDSEEEASYDRFEWEKEIKGLSLGRRIVHMRGDSIATIGRELTTVVRKNFARTVQQLIQHGLRIPAESAASSLMVPFMRCLHPGTQRMAAPSAQESQFLGLGRGMHAWELILEYYQLKHGEEYNNTPARKLSLSFQLDIVDAQAVTAKQSLLSTVGMILAMHKPYKRSHNAHFKAFVCAGLNSHLLVEWLNLILSCNELIDTYYSSTSYVARTGFRDSLRSIDALSKFDFDLPVDLAIRHFRNI